MPLDLSQPLHWDTDDVLKWLDTLGTGKFVKSYGKKFIKAGLTGEDLLRFESSSELSEAAGFGSKRKEAKDLRTIWQGISTLKEKTKEKNYAAVPYQQWDAPKFLAWLHSPSVDLGQYAERFSKVHSPGDDIGQMLTNVTDKTLEEKYLMTDASDRKQFFKMLGEAEITQAASRGKDMLAGVFGGSSSPAASASKSKSSAKKSSGLNLGGLNFGPGPSVGGSESRGRNRESKKDVLDMLNDELDEDIPVRSARKQAPGSADKKKPSSGFSLGALKIGGSPASGGRVKVRNHSISRGGPKPTGITGINLFSAGGPAPGKRRSSAANMVGVGLLSSSDEEDNDGNEYGEDEFDDGDLFDADEVLGTTQKRPDGNNATGTFSTSGRLQLPGKTEISELGLHTNEDANELRERENENRHYESKLEAKMGISPGARIARARSGSSDASNHTPRRTARKNSRERSASRDLRASPDTIIMAHQIIQREKLGQGAGGIVYRAIHAPTLRVVALKKVRVQDAAKKAQVMAEVAGLRCNMVELTAPLGAVAPCPCLLTFHGAFTNPQSRSVSLLLEFMDGGDLNDFTDAGQKVPEPLLANIAFRLLTGLTYLHKNNQVHRDIKPHNVLMHKSGMVKISDLGIAKAINENQKFTETFTGTTLYMSPERLKGESYGYLADIWSVGLTVMTLAMGRPPIEGKGGFWGISAAVVDKPPPRLPVKGYSRELRDFCDCCLKNDPAKRLPAKSLLKHAWIRQHVAENKRGNLTSTVVRNNFMSNDGPKSNEEAMSALGATWSKLSSTTDRAAVGSAATRAKFVKMQEDVDELHKYFFEKHIDDPAYDDLRPSREAVLCYIKQCGLLDQRERCIKMFKKAKLW